MILKRTYPKINNNRGIALLSSIFFTVVLFGISTAFIVRTFNESKDVLVDRHKTNAFFAAQAGSQAALNQLNTLINTYLQTTIAAASPSGVASSAGSAVSSNDGIGWLINAVRDNNVPVLTQNGEQAEYSATTSVGTASYSYLIVITEKEDPLSAGTDAWDFPYNFEIEVTGISEDVTSDLYINGDFTVRVQKDNFAKFALFTNEQQTQGGSNVWFTDKTNFSGPVHTNDRFNFALNPSGTFYEQVTQVEDTARFYNSGFPVLLDADLNETEDVPDFEAGFYRDEAPITFTASTEEQDMADQALGGETVTSDGIYLPNSSGSLTGGIYIQGNSSINLSTDTSNRAVYTITQGSSTKTITVDHTNQQTIVNDLGSGTTTTYTGRPDGIDDAGTLIYANGLVASLGGTVQSDTEITIGSSTDIVINDHVKYSNYTPDNGTPGTSGYTPPSAAGAINVLGLISWNGNVRVGTSAPDDIEVHSTVMAPNGVFEVDNFTDQGVGPRGTATLLGGVISDNYGGFGQFSGSTGNQIAGFGRNFVYDTRMQEGTSPPYFPTLDTFIAFTNDIVDKLLWQEGE